MLVIRPIAVILVQAVLFAGLSSFAHAATPAPVLFRDVNVVGMTDTRVEKHRDVLVSNGTISKIGAAGSITLPPGAVSVDGKGRYLMPGLAEMHAHLPPRAQEQNAQDVLLLYLAHGVTTIRGMLGDAWHLELRKQLERQEVLGPRLYTAGPSFNGNSVPTIERAQAQVREQAAAGYDFLKMHPGIKRDVFDAIVASARSANITFQGHVSEDVGVMHALEMKQRAIDHLDGYVQGIVDPACIKGPTAQGIFGTGVVHCADVKRIPVLVQQTKAAGTWMVPTQILLEQWALPPSKEALLARPALRYMPAGTGERWMEGLRNFIGAPGLSQDRGRKYVAVTRALIREMHAQGVPILLGSDAPQVFNVPGDSALEELAVYAQIGLTPFEALKTATVNPARFFNAGKFGRVRAGLEADLILLEANPLDDVRATRKLAGVMARGRWVPRTELDEKLEAMRKRVNPSAT
jgi:hypothetical protein